MKKVFSLLLITYFISVVTSAHADYVLPYPSYMPGNTLYKVSRVIDQLKRFWYFGNIAQVKYHLGLSDKYLVEAKTLMEYNQYLLGADALARSDKEFMQLTKYLTGAMNEGIDITQLKQTVNEAAVKHLNVLSYLQTTVPPQFVWKPEKAAATQLSLLDDIKTSQAIRQEVIDTLPR